MQIWLFLLRTIEAVSGLYYFLVPVLVMGLFAFVIRLAQHKYY